MVDIAFSREELENLKLSQLIVLADYHEVNYRKRSSKGTMVEMLYNFYHPDTGIVYNESGDSGELQMSVRIRRIKESGKNVR